MKVRILLILLLNFVLMSAGFAQRTDMRLAFVSTRDGNSEIYVIDMNGKNLKRLTKNPGLDSFPVWSPDARKIAFISGDPADGNSLEVYVMNADGSNPKNLTQNRAEEFGFPAWSPDGTKIAFETYRDFNGEIYGMNPDGSNPENLTKSPLHDGSPAWSPDGKKIAFVSGRDGGELEIYLMNADGSNPQNLTKHRADDQSPRWSPDGSKITFSSNRNGEYQRFVMDTDGRNTAKLKDLPFGVTSPDGKLVAYVSKQDGNSEIYVMNADGSNPKNLTKHRGHEWSPAWSPIPNLAVFPDQSLLVTTWARIKRESTQ